MQQGDGLTRRLVGRRAVLAGGAAVAVAAVPLRHARAAEKLTVRLDWITHGLQAPFFLAQERGWFADNGLDVSIEDGNGSATTVQLVAAGQFDVGFAALGPMALARAKGLDVISTAGFVPRGDTGFLVPKESGWTKPSDLIGKTIDYTAGSLEGPFMIPFFRKNNIPIDKLKLSNVAAAAKTSLYVEGKFDSTVTAVPYVLPLVAKSRPSTGILFADFGMNLPGAGIVVRASTLKARGPEIRRLTSIICAAFTYIYGGHMEQGAQAVLKYRPHAAESAAIMVEELTNYSHNAVTPNTKGLPLGMQTDKDWAGVIADMSSAKTIPASSKPAEFFTNAYIDKAMIKKLAGTA